MIWWLADLKSRYICTLEDRASSVSDSGQYKVSGGPSHTLLMKMKRESAWWTEQPAKKASKTVVIAMFVVGLAALAIVLGGLEVEGETATDIASEILRQGYGLAICAIVLLDTCKPWTEVQQIKRSSEGFKARIHSSVGASR